MAQKKDKKINSEEPLIDKSGELLKKLIAKGKRQGFLKRDECENILEDGQFEDKDEFYSKIENLNIQIYENDADDSSSDEEENGIAAKSTAEKDSDTGRADDPGSYYYDTELALPVNGGEISSGYYDRPWMYSSPREINFFARFDFN